MGALNKPMHCGQDWLDMKPVKGGSLCAQCNKIIVDFTKKRWKEIEELQAQHTNSICGMYTDKQLEHWGREIPASAMNKTIVTATAALCISMATAVSGQTISKSKTKKQMIVCGVITEKSKGENPGMIPMRAIVRLRGTAYKVWSNTNGEYAVNLAPYLDTLRKPTLIFEFLGYENVELDLNGITNPELEFNVELKEIPSIPPVTTSYTISTSYYVKAPAISQKTKRKFKNLFKKNSHKLG
jgi:hypothetical protein